MKAKKKVINKSLFVFQQFTFITIKSIKNILTFQFISHMIDHFFLSFFFVTKRQINEQNKTILLI